MEALKSEGVIELAATGYCFGGIFWFQIILITKDTKWFIWLGRYTFDLAFESVIKVAVVSHPSLLKVPEDLEVWSVWFSSVSFFTLYRSVLILHSLLLFFSFFVVHQFESYLKNARNTPPLPKLLSSSTRALLINNSHSRHLLKPMRSLEVASSLQDTKGSTLKGARMDLLSVAIWMIQK